MEKPADFMKKKLTRDHIIYILTDCIYETSNNFFQILF